jgi:hypothetical protein
LLDLNDRLEDEVLSARHFQNDFHRVDKEAAILTEKLKLKIATDVMSGVCLSSGFGLIGLVKSIWQTQPSAAIILGLAILLIAGGILVKVIKK